MGTSQNYSLPWPEPTDAQLAFPALAKTLAETVDTELNNLHTKNLTQDSQIGAMDGEISDLIDGLNLVDSEKVDGAGMTLRRDTTVGTRVFLDHPGGTTMLSGDTGWRNITGLLLNGWTSTSLRIRRINNIVEIQGRLDATAKTDDKFLEIPSGFGFAGGSYTKNSRVGPGRLILLAGGSLSSDSTTAYGDLQEIWMTQESWPSSFPGTPA